MTKAKSTPGVNRTGPEEKDNRDNNKGDGMIHSKDAKNTNRRAVDSEKSTMQAEDNERAGHPRVAPEDKGTNRPGAAR